MLRFYSLVFELEAMYKFSTDIFSLAEHTDWALQSFALRQAICAIFQIIWMDAQRTCIWRTVNSSVEAHNSPSLCFFLTRERERERKSLTYHAELTRYM